MYTWMKFVCEHAHMHAHTHTEENLRFVCSEWGAICGFNSHTLVQLYLCPCAHAHFPKGGGKMIGM